MYVNVRTCFYFYTKCCYFFSLFIRTFFFSFQPFKFEILWYFKNGFWLGVSPTILILYRHPANYGCRFFLKIIFPFFSNWIFLFILSVTFSLFVLFCLFFFFDNSFPFLRPTVKNVHIL